MIIKFKIKEKREERGISLRQLAEETGIDRKYLSEIEENKIPADEILFAEIIVIADALGFRISDLYDIEKLEIKGIGSF